MKKKRRVLFLVLSIVAAGAVAGSAFLRWWKGAWPMTTDGIQLLNSVKIPSITEFYLSIGMMLLVAAGLFLLAMIGAWKFVSFLGMGITAAVIVLWTIVSGVSLDRITTDVGSAPGVLVASGGVIVGVVLLFLPKKRNRYSRRWMKSRDD
jgi:hypothetical protein